MRRRSTTLALLALTLGLGLAAVATASGATGDVARAGGVQLVLPDGWSKVVTRDTSVDWSV